MSVRPFRFGVSSLLTGSRAAWRDKAKKAEDLGYDVLLVPDHLGMQAPFPALVAAADVTRLRLGTLVLNTSFYNPALLARDVAETDQLTDGRLELGLGAGYGEAEFESAGLRFPPAGERIDHLAHTVSELRRLFSSEAQVPTVRQRPGPRLLLGGHGDRLLRLAAREADTVGFLGHLGHEALADRVGFVRSEAGERFDDLELSLFVSGVAVDGDGDLGLVRQMAAGLSDEEILRLPGVLTGSAQEIAETLLEYRAKYGITYFTALEMHMDAFAKVISHLR
jgi:probable F420-dependent oxidoreductase